jgi:hypothetical protein
VIDFPSPVEILEAAADVLDGLTTAGVVARDPVYSEEFREYAELLVGDDGVVDGWLVEWGPEEPEGREPAGATSGFGTLLLTAMVQVNPNRADGTSLDYFGEKVREAKAAFRLRANEDLGLGAERFRQFFLTAPNGYQRVPVDTRIIHLAPMELRYWGKGC